jgi:RNA polymerase sigma-70 factor (ECF subfamily)
MALVPTARTALSTHRGGSDLLLSPIAGLCSRPEGWGRLNLWNVLTHLIEMLNSTDQFEAIVREYYAPLFRFALSLVRVESDAWDLTQQTFYVWATKGHQLRDATKVKSWLFTTLHRAFLVARKRRTQFPEETLEDVVLQLPSFSPEPSLYPDYSEVLPALARVDNIYQAALALYYLKDCSYQGIAAILGVPLGTVKSRIARGIAQLRELMYSSEIEPSSSHA